MEPLFETKLTIDFQEYARFSNALFFQRKVRLAILACLIILIAILGYPWISLLYIGIILLIILIRQGVIRKAYRKNKLMRESEVVCKFYPDHMTVSQATAFAEIPYDKLDRILETKKCFYLMTGLNQGQIVRKADCNETMTAFFRELRQKYK